MFHCMEAHKQSEETIADLNSRIADLQRLDSQEEGYIGMGIVIFVLWVIGMVVIFSR